MRVEKMKKNKFLTIFVVFLAFTTSAAAFSGGDGTPENPYEIDRCRYLQDIRDDMSANYELTDDLDCSDTTSWNSENGFATLGAYSQDDPEINSGFTGSLDGNGHTISGLFIDRSEATFLGMFSYIKQDGVVKNLNLQEADIRGERYLGGIAGRNNGEIIDVSVSGNIRGEEYVGGIVGLNGGFVSNSYSMGRINSDDRAAGGIAGQNSNDIYLSYSTASIKGEMSGGIAALNLGNIARSFSTGTIEGSRAGGVAGANGYSVRLEADDSEGILHTPGEIENSYSSATIDGSYSGGVVAVNNGTIQNTYATGAIYGAEEDAGGLVGENHGESNIQSSYYDEITTGYTRSAGGSDLLTVDMKKKSSYEDWDFEKVWSMSEEDYPQLDVSSYTALNDDGQVEVVSSDENISNSLDNVKDWEGDLTGFRVSDTGEDVVYVSTVSGDSIQVTGGLNKTRPKNISFKIRPDSGCEEESCRTVSFLNQDGETAFEITTEARVNDCGFGCSVTESGYSFNGRYTEEDRESWTEFQLNTIDYEKNKISEVKIGSKVLATDVSMNSNASNITKIRLNSESKTGGIYLKKLELEGEAKKESETSEIKKPSDLSVEAKAEHGFEGSLGGEWKNYGPYQLSDTSYSGDGSLRVGSDEESSFELDRTVNSGQVVSLWVATEGENSNERGMKIGNQEHVRVYFKDGEISFNGDQIEETKLTDTLEGKDWYKVEAEILREGKAQIRIKDSEGTLRAEKMVERSTQPEYQVVQLYSEKSSESGHTWFDAVDFSQGTLLEEDEEEPDETGTDESDENKPETDDNQEESENEGGSEEGSQEEKDDSGGIMSGIVGFLKATFS